MTGTHFGGIGRRKFSWMGITHYGRMPSGNSSGQLKMSELHGITFKLASRQSREIQITPKSSCGCGIALADPALPTLTFPKTEMMTNLSHVLVLFGWKVSVGVCIVAMTPQF